MKTGPKLHATGPRVRLAGSGPTVRADVARSLASWSAAGISLGKGIDALYDYAHKDPESRLRFNFELTAAKTEQKTQ